SVGPLSSGTITAASAPSSASLARRFLATFTAAPACFICRRGASTWAHLSPATPAWRGPNAGRTALLRSCPPARQTPRSAFEVPTGRGALGPQNGLPRLCRPLSRKPAPAVSDRMDVRKPPGTSWRPKEIARLGPVPFREIPQDAQKEKSPNRHVFLEARKGAPTHQGRHALTVM